MRLQFTQQHQMTETEPQSLTRPAIEIAPTTGRLTVLVCKSAIETIILKQLVKLPLQLADLQY